MKTQRCAISNTSKLTPEPCLKKHSLPNNEGSASPGTPAPISSPAAADIVLGFTGAQHFLLKLKGKGKNRKPFGNHENVYLKNCGIKMSCYRLLKPEQKEKITSTSSLPMRNYNLNRTEAEMWQFQLSGFAFEAT